MELGVEVEPLPEGVEDLPAGDVSGEDEVPEGVEEVPEGVEAELTIVDEDDLDYVVDEDEEEYTITKIMDDEYLVSGSCDIEDLEEILNIGMPVDDYETVSGFIIGHLGRIPTEEDVINDDSDFVFNQYLFSIEDTDEKVISKIRVTKEDSNEIDSEKESDKK